MGHLSKENVSFSALRFLFHLWLLTESSFTRSFHGRHFFSISFGGKTIHGWSFLFWRENKNKENFRNMSRIICTAKRPVTQVLSLSASLSGKTINLLDCCRFWRETINARSSQVEIIIRSSHVLGHYHAMIGQQLRLYMQN